MPPTPPRAHKPAGAPAPDDDRIPLRLIVFGVLLVYGVLFAVLNSETVNISFVFFPPDVSLVLVIVLALVIGFAAGYLFVEMAQRRRRRREKPT